MCQLKFKVPFKLQSNLSPIYVQNEIKTTGPWKATQPTLQRDFVALIDIRDDSILKRQKLRSEYRIT